MIILGIDPGLATLGYGVIDAQDGKNRLVQYGVLTTPKNVEIPFRLQAILRGMYQLMDIYQPEEVAFEELFFSKNITTGINVGMARGVALAAVADRTDQLFEYTPMQIKQAVTGYGKADKHQVQMMVKMLLNMQEIARPDDAADALAVAITHASCRRTGQLFRIH
ncbi:MAG: crossover junction endodeoxyribonuclease RuvC [Clostridia bacterium]|nr:crossover junction endodeoxyribonuclease RuvC [Clostridia bacterium]MBQ8973384.1 crossover junction endodeoxyribonuclease RuvC [Clostridia bacterium]